MLAWEASNRGSHLWCLLGRLKWYWTEDKIMHVKLHWAEDKRTHGKWKFKQSSKRCLDISALNYLFVGFPFYLRYLWRYVKYNKWRRISSAGFGLHYSYAYWKLLNHSRDGWKLSWAMSSETILSHYLVCNSYMQSIWAESVVELELWYPNARIILGALIYDLGSVSIIGCNSFGPLTSFNRSRRTWANITSSVFYSL